MSKQIICTALAVLFVTCIRAQGFGEIHGKVMDRNGNAIVGAIVIADDGSSQIGNSTDLNGRFRLNPVSAGTYSVSASFVGMDMMKFSGVVVNPDLITNTKNFVLEESSVYGPTVVIEDYRDPLIKRDGSQVQTITAKDLKNLPAANGGKVSQIVLTLSSDIRPAEEGGGLSVRGSREGGVLYFVDGVKVRGSEVSIPSSGISSVSVYSGGIPAKYGDTTGGVVVVETKSYLEDFYKKLTN